ncbi:CubicO group peptidase (beta-lactamase class C family) [Scopulibacillus daqui]|uniref:CubicO group peptidase (Beta-lactamase class C family) n=1 Tax=Scopulibacillus daqui TaxID=1469162 RepID=A0ABS2PVT4_9BACL|nr:serine hydrolase domain-containing protein [Scopulibacillus daqui]MBM7644174.1 CubicO group peptidase (beta-lactamase class C family) [Scopulibacillus daqui]
MQKILCFFLALSIFIIGVSGKSLADGQTNQQKKIDQLITNDMKKGKIPGLAVVIIKNGQTIYKKGYGYADMKSKKRVSGSTKFQLASLTKAFTGLEIMRLANLGFINLNDSVSEYISWFHVNYNGKPVQITVKELLEQSSGIPSDDILRIPVSTADDALEKGVKHVAGINLSSQPGEKFIYSNINFNILGLIIETVTGKKYEDVMRQAVFHPLGLNHTSVRTTPNPDHMTKGYKVSFLAPREYFKPADKSIGPAANIILDSRDMERWMAINLGLVKIPGLQLISLSDDNKFHYFAGWMFDPDESIIYHSGNLPNNSAYILLEPKNKNGIAVLANSNSPYTRAIAKGIDNILHGKEGFGEYKDEFVYADRVSTIAVIFCCPMILLLLWRLVTIVRQMHQKQRVYIRNGLSYCTIIAAIILIAAICLTAYRLPSLVFGNPYWSYVNDWYSSAVKYAATLFVCFSILLITNLTLAINTKQTNQSF